MMAPPPLCLRGQDTPTAKRCTNNYVFFESTVYLQTPVNKLPHGSAIFFEFKHFKLKKNKVCGKV